MINIIECSAKCTAVMWTGVILLCAQRMICISNGYTGLLHGGKDSFLI